MDDQHHKGCDHEHIQGHDHNHDHDDHASTCDCGHHHKHQHDHHDHQGNPVDSHPRMNENLFGESGELPAVLSGVFPIDFPDGISGDALGGRLTALMVAIKQWTVNNKCFIGHVKAFAEDGDTFHIWLSTTGGKINSEEARDSVDRTIKHCKLHFTAIIFGTDEKTLETVVLENINRLI